MHLTREALDVWAGNQHRLPYGKYVLLLAEGDSVDGPGFDPAVVLVPIEGPAVVELVVYRDGGWSARALQHETVESIALAASLAQRGNGHDCSLIHPGSVCSASGGIR